MSAAPALDKSLLDKLDDVVPGLARLDAFPKLPSTYKARSESRGFLTLFVILLAFLLVLNDLAEYIWGWPDYEFSVDAQSSSFMNVNVDMVVNTPCAFLSVDLRDAVGDRLYLSKGFHRDGTVFDVGQATAFKEHAKALSARQVISQSRKSRGLFSFFRRSQSDYRPTYNHKQDGDACRIYGTLAVKKVTANLHITTLGHGYASAVHVPHDKMNLSHVITEFSFGPYFPDIAQPLDYSFELAKDHFMTYQYYLHVVPTTYVAPRSAPVHTNQYSVTHYTRKLDAHLGTPGIYFKFDLDPMVITIHQRTTSLAQLLIRCVGVIGGVFTCASYFLRATVRTLEAVSGADSTPGIVAAESTSVRRKWVGGSLRARPNATSGRVMRQGSGWVVDGMTTPTPTTGGFGPAPSPYAYPQSPFPSGSPAVQTQLLPSASSPMPPPHATSQSLSVLPTQVGGGSVPSSPAGGGVGLGLHAAGFTHSHSHSHSHTYSHSHSRTVSVASVGPPPRSRPSSMYMNVSGDFAGGVGGPAQQAVGSSVPSSPYLGAQPGLTPPPPKSAKKDD